MLAAIHLTAADPARHAHHGRGGARGLERGRFRLPWEQPAVVRWCRWLRRLRKVTPGCGADRQQSGALNRSPWWLHAASRGTDGLSCQLMAQPLWAGCPVSLVGALPVAGLLQPRDARECRTLARPARTLARPAGPPDARQARGLADRPSLRRETPRNVLALDGATSPPRGRVQGIDLRGATTWPARSRRRRKACDHSLPSCLANAFSFSTTS
jgi:hypothetical protein